ncbi:MAG: sulfurtransferase, partial [Oscillospiraceae bacterium]|nr:sulfurtransferase [Oscillospiraceae bacterium]
MRKTLSLLLTFALIVSLFAMSGVLAFAAEETAEVTERTVYVTPEWLNSALNGDVAGYEDVVVVCVAYPGSTDVYTAYGEGHVPGAIYASIMEVEDATGSEEGAYNLLSAEEVRDFLLGHGITADTKVVLYGPDVCGVARQAYGYLWCGVKDVKVLNGGLAAWTAAGFEVETDANTLEAAADFGVEVPAHPEYWVSLEEAKDRPASDDNFKLVSIRTEGEWLGETSGYSYMDKAGEPEGAVWG